MLHPATELTFIDAVFGHGVIATEPIFEGTIAWTRDPLDQVIPDVHRRALEEPFRALVERYSFGHGRGDGLLCWDHTRFVNHSCDANVLGLGARLQIAVRDIAPGEQLTFDYRHFGGQAGFQCYCGAMECAGTLWPCASTDLEARWRSKLVGGLEALFTVPQPLMPMVGDSEPTLEALWDGGPDLVLDRPAPPVLHVVGR